MGYWGYNPFTNHLLNFWDIQVGKKVEKIWVKLTWWEKYERNTFESTSETKMCWNITYRICEKKPEISSTHPFYQCLNVLEQVLRDIDLVWFSQL